MLIHARAVAVALAAVAVASVGCPAPDAPADVPDSPEARAEKVREIVRLDIEHGGLVERIDTGAEVALDATAGALEDEIGRALTDEERERVRTVLRTVIGEFVTAERWEALLTEVYVPHFTASELETIRAFFASPTGAKMLELEQRLANEIDDRTGALIEDRIDEFAARLDEELAAAFEEYTPENAP